MVAFLKDFFLLIAFPYYCPLLFSVSGILKCSSVKSLPQADNKAEENPKNENSSPCLVICVLDRLSSIFALSSPNFVVKERFSCVTEDLMCFTVLWRVLVVQVMCAYWVSNIHVLILVFLAVVI